MFDDNEKPVSENQVPSPPAPPQPAIKPTEPVVEPPPPTGDSPHMDLPLTPKTPHSTSKIKIIIASLAGLILLGGIGYGGWWAYTDYLEGDISNITKIFSATEEQEQVVEADEQENQMEEEPEVMVETNHYTFNESYVLFEETQDVVTLSGFIEIADDLSTFNMSVDLVTAVGTERSQEDLDNLFDTLLGSGVGWPIFLVNMLNPEYKSFGIKKAFDKSGEEVNSDIILSNFNLLIDYKNSLPIFVDSFDNTLNSGATLANLEYSMEIVQEDLIYPVIRFRFDDTSDNVAVAIYNVNGESKTSNMGFAELLEIDHRLDLYPSDPIIEINPDSKRISDAKQIQTALALYYVNNKNYPISEEVMVLDNTLQLCDSGFVGTDVECSSTAYMAQIPQDPGDAYYTYRSPIGTWYEVIFKLSDDYDGGLNLQPGLNVATPDGIVPYGNPEEDDDGDGLINSLEEENGTDVSNRDTDSDGLSDYDEVIWWETDPLNWDTDGDEFGDGEEIHNGFNPLGEGRYFE